MDMTITALLENYRSGSITPAQVIDQCLQKAQQFKQHNLWITQLTRDQIEIYLQKLTHQSPDTLPLFGIPFVIKDNIDLIDIPTTAACPAFAYTPAQSAFVVQTLIDAGAIPLGKTNMDQFATGLVGTRSPEPWGPCKNAFNTEYISGGSSSGSAVAVALGIASFSLATDTAGSGRVPAAFNNIVGVKPTRGLISTCGTVPACRSLDCVSVFALCLHDANLVLTIAVNYDVNDDYARHNTFANNPRHFGVPFETITCAIPLTEQLEFFGDTGAQNLFDNAVQRLVRSGVKIEEHDFSSLFRTARLLYEGPWTSERYIAIEKILNQNPNDVLPIIRYIIEPAKDNSAVDYYTSAYRLQHYKNEAQKLFDQVDVLLTPTAGTIYRIDEVLAQPLKLNSNLGYYTNYVNLLDCCAVAVPAGFLDNDLPWGITFTGPALHDRKVMSIANHWLNLTSQQSGVLDGVREIQPSNKISFDQSLLLVVCGAHMQGLPLNWQLTERNAFFVKKTRTAPVYRMYVLPNGPPYRPGLIRDEKAGNEIEAEIWSIPKLEFGDFVAKLPLPLGIGKVEMQDSTWLNGFICEPYAVRDAEEITYLASWRRYLETKS